MSEKLANEEAESRVLQVLLVLAIAGSIICDVLDVDSKWQVPFIFTSILAIFRIVAQLRTRQNAVRVEVFKNNSEFYASAQRMIGRAEQRVLASYVRLVPPPGFNSAEAESYFRFGIQWARKHPQGELRRIIGDTGDVQLRKWICEHYDQTRKVANYNIRIVPHNWRIDAVNMVLIDESMVYLAISSDGQSMAGLGLHSREAVEALREYYQWWWSCAEPIEKFVARVGKKILM